MVFFLLVVTVSPILTADVSGKESRNLDLALCKELCSAILQKCLTEVNNCPTNPVEKQRKAKGDCARKHTACAQSCRKAFGRLILD
ncbi:hypothetical protein LSAT2_016725 [Lamellibrachia satsuma]|nr:hypothetical protein LSAT2_016725 [Lamellibrachia satsuma]